MIILITILIIVAALPTIMIIHSRIIQYRTVLYKIKKGKHYSYRLHDLLPITWKMGIVRGSRLEFDFLFDGGCEYPLSGTNDDADVNKLYGYSLGFDDQYRSIRIGWRHVGKGDIQLFSYIHNNGKRIISYLYTVKAYETYRALMLLGKGCVNIKILKDGNLLTDSTTLVNTSSDLVKFKLWPYFGGNLRAPQAMGLYITEKK